MDRGAIHTCNKRWLSPARGRSSALLQQTKAAGSGPVIQRQPINLPGAACLTIPIGRARIFHLVSSNRVGIHSRCSSHHPSCSITAGGSGSDGARSRGGHRQRRLAERGPYWPPQRQAANAVRLVPISDIASGGWLSSTAFEFAVRGVFTPQVAAKTIRCCKAQRKLRSARGSLLSLARFLMSTEEGCVAAILPVGPLGPPCGKSRNMKGKPQSVVS
jgi:hypothetical protein